MLNVKKTLKVAGLSLAAAVLFSFSSYGASSVQGAVGVVNMRQVMQAIPQVPSMQKKVQKQFSAEQKKLEKMQISVQQEQAKLKKNQSIMSKASLMKAAQKFQENAQKLQASQADYQRKVMAAQNRAMNSLMQTIQKAASVVAKENHLVLIMPGDNLLYAKPGHDYTKMLIKRLKKA